MLSEWEQNHCLWSGKSRGKSSVFSPHKKLGAPGCRLVLEGGTLTGDSENDLPNHPEKCLSNERRGRDRATCGPQTNADGEAKRRGQRRLSRRGRGVNGGEGGGSTQTTPGTGAAAGEPGRLRPLPATLGHPEPLTRVCPELRGSLLSGGRTALGDEPGNTDG